MSPLISLVLRVKQRYGILYKPFIVLLSLSVKHFFLQMRVAKTALISFTYGLVKTRTVR